MNYPIYDALMRMVGTKYIWGGASYDGFDCSGFVQEVLAMQGMDPPGDQTAQALYNWLKPLEKENEIVGFGHLCFYGEDRAKVTHVGYTLTERLMIEAGGGNSYTLTLANAILKNAFVRIRPIKYRKDFLCTIKPEYK